MPVGKSSIKRMNASQETEEKKEAEARVEHIPVENVHVEKTAEPEKKETAAHKKDTAPKKASAARKPRTAAKKTAAPKKQDNHAQEPERIGEGEEKESGVISNITCELPIYLM